MCKACHHHKYLFNPVCVTCIRHTALPHYHITSIQLYYNMLHTESQKFPLSEINKYKSITTRAGTKLGQGWDMIRPNMICRKIPT